MSLRATHADQYRPDVIPKRNQALQIFQKNEDVKRCLEKKNYATDLFNGKHSIDRNTLDSKNMVCHRHLEHNLFSSRLNFMCEKVLQR